MSSRGPSGRSTGMPTGREALLLAPLVGATVALLWIVPEVPLARLDDPSQWGVIGFLVVAAGLIRATLRSGGEGATRRLLAMLLAGMPLVYLADWARFGGSFGWLGVEMAGALLYGSVAWTGLTGRAWLLPAGIVGHALWDLAHHGATPFVPDWYVVACVVVDLATGVHAAEWAGRMTTRRSARRDP